VQKSGLGGHSIAEIHAMILPSSAEGIRLLGMTLSSLDTTEGKYEPQLTFAL